MKTLKKKKERIGEETQTRKCWWLAQDRIYRKVESDHGIGSEFTWKVRRAMGKLKSETDKKTTLALTQKSLRKEKYF